jgi:hypothetical protein
MCDPAKEFKRAGRKLEKQAKRTVPQITEAATLGLTRDPVAAATFGTITTEGGGVQVAGQPIIAGELPPLPKEPTREEAAISAQEAERERRRSAKGKRRTILTSPRGVETAGPGRKTLLGQ